MYGRFLELAMSARLCVLTGQGREEIVPTDTYRRLGHDLVMADIHVIGDLHGLELEALLDEGRLDILKVSEEDLIADGAISDDSEGEAIRAVGRLLEAGAEAVVLSRSDRPVLASFESGTYRATPPALEPADFRGAGDSMTAGLVTAFNRGLGPEETLRLACGAGAANTTRHGLGSAATDLIASLAARVEIESLTSERD
jgi:1-phosphofructokinase